MSLKKKLLIVGQTPPPYHGQSIMIENTVNHKFKNLEIYHVRMHFSKGIDDIGRFSVKKVFLLFNLIAKIIKIRIKHNVRHLYYPPAGPNSGPIFRDAVILGITRFYFKTTIYHFRAGGISEKLESYHWFLKGILNFIYRKPNLSIRLSAKNPDDGRYFKSKSDVIIPNGLKDYYTDFPEFKVNSKTPVLLYVGAIKESKGVLDLLRACRLLHHKDFIFELHLIGEPDSKEFDYQVQKFIEDNYLSKKVKFLGIKTGEAKWREFAKSDIFCFPSFYECETFGNVLIEAMQYSLPVVATNWRGISDIVVDEKTGFLIEINKPQMLAKAISILLESEALRQKFGKAGRLRYESNFQEQKYFDNFEKNILQVID